MPRTMNPIQLVDRAVAQLAARDQRVVLAVSGGLDSMVLLDACARVAPDRVVAVASFDHRTGASATAAVRHVRREGAARGLPVVAGRAERAEATESEWRAARWRFLSRVARDVDAAVATAHTADDQAETVFMRLLRGAGARGLAGLLAPSAIRRPFVELPRAVLATYAAARGVAYVDDPSNRSRRHLRNRVRLDLLPALERADPGFRAWLLALGRRSAVWRAEVEAFAATLEPRPLPGGGLSVACDGLQGYDAAALSVLWPALAARAGVALDWRGTRRLAEFSSCGVVGGVVPLSAGFEVVRRRDAFELRRAAPRESLGDSRQAPRPLAGELTFGCWRFRLARPGEERGVWSAELPAGGVRVRAWRAGDRMRVADGRPGRRVKRFFADAGVPGTDRAGWPVVLAADEIVWIPGVCRSDAAPVRSGRPLRYLCERIYDA